MRKTTLVTISLVLGLTVLAASPSPAYNSIGSSFRSTYPDACQTLLDATTNAQGCVLCHVPGSGWNAYGEALKAAGRDFAAIENLDSDGDGRTNIEEILQDCTFPGDAISPDEPDAWGAIKALYR